MKHTILGAGGAIGNALAYKLLENNENLRLVSRSKVLIPGTESVKADLNSYHETLQSVKQTDVVYLCVGLPYDLKIWKESWPKIMQNTINACKDTGARLIFFDNVYMYGKVDGKMMETTPYNPCSKKGEFRAKLARTLEEEVARKNINAIIARAADFYGPYATKTSVPYQLVLDKLLHNKKAQWIVDVDKPHSFSYTLDCANGLYLLANDERTFNQIWHLPTYSPAIDGKTFIEIAAKEIGTKARYSIFSKFMIKMAGLFDVTLSEIYEMLYQNKYEYHFDSTKFNNYFRYQPTSYLDGIKETIQFLRNGG